MGTHYSLRLTDDVGKNANDMDLYQKDKEMDQPEELDIAKQVELAEEEQK